MSDLLLENGYSFLLESGSALLLEAAMSLGTTATTATAGAATLPAAPVGEMDLLLQPSYTESFNMITADGIVCGVPSVVSSAITWAPKEWRADSDDAMDIAKVGISILNNPHAIHEGVAAIKRQNENGLRQWMYYLRQK